jgi:hypothetical protein
MADDQVARIKHFNTLTNPHGIGVIGQGPDGSVTQGFAWFVTNLTSDRESEHRAAVRLDAEDALVTALAERLSPGPPPAR